MEATQTTENTPTPLIVALARELAERIPQLEGRVIAVSEVEPFSGDTDVPTLPLGVVGLIGEQGQQTVNGGGQIKLEGQVAVQLMLESLRHKRKDGSNTPFYAFYDYEAIRDAVLAITHYWRTPRNGSITYRSMEVSSDTYAVSIMMEFVTSELWCPPVNDPVDGPHRFTVNPKLLQPKGKCEELLYADNESESC